MYICCATIFKKATHATEQNRIAIKGANIFWWLVGDVIDGKLAMQHQSRLFVLTSAAVIYLYGTTAACYATRRGVFCLRCTLRFSPVHENGWNVSAEAAATCAASVKKQQQCTTCYARPALENVFRHGVQRRTVRCMCGVRWCVCVCV